MMSISQVPPGFRFHPTEEELLQYYLKKKVGSEKIDLDVIQDVDLNKLEPWDIQDKCKIGSSENDWYFFSHKDKKYPTGTRTNRATRSGFWKATGRDKVIYGNSSSSRSRIGMRKTLVFYKGRAPHGQKSDWIMHEYRLDGIMGSSEEGWVICRVFKKKNQINHSSTKSSTTSTSCCWSSMSNEAADGTLEEMLQLYSMRSRNDDHAEENNNNNNNNRRFLKLPSLQYYDISESERYSNNNINGIQDWASLDHESRLMLMSRGTSFLDEQQLPLHFHADHHSHISSNSTTSTPAAYNQPHLWTSPHLY